MSDNWICWRLFLDEWEFFLKPSQTTCGNVGAVWQFSKGFLTRRLNCFLQFSSCGPWRVFNHSNSPSHRTLGQYRHMSSSRQFRYILCWLEIFNYCPDSGNGNFHCSSSFLKATSLICEAQSETHLHIRNVFFVFSHCHEWLREFGLCFPPIYISVKQEDMAG